LFHKFWFNVVAAIVSLAITYGFVSWAINSGNLLTYAASIFFFTLAINRLILGIRYALGR